MNKTWWRSAKDVDPDQVRIYALPPGGRRLILGAPGSGKTNVLLLRAVYLAQSGRANLKVLTFSRSLVEFIRSGVRENGRIPEDRIQTIAEWQLRLHKEITGREFSLTDQNDHDLCRQERGEQLLEAIGHARLQLGHYDALLVDEAQDLWAVEVEIFSRLGAELFFVADARQRIYSRNEGLSAIRSLGVSEDSLKFHYRIGRKICEAADRILPAEGASLSEFCQYDEVALPSTVGMHKCDSRQDQMKAILARLETQLRAYPDEWIGIIAPRNFILDKLERYVSGTKFEGLLCVHRSGNRSFVPERPIVAMTAHSAKGTEFRAVHILGAESFSPHYTREIGFTVVTRAKTAVDCYYTNSTDGSLVAALSEERVPDPREVFGQ